MGIFSSCFLESLLGMGNQCIWYLQVFTSHQIHLEYLFFFKLWDLWKMGVNTWGWMGKGYNLNATASHSSYQVL